MVKEKEYYHVEKPLMEQLSALGWDIILNHPNDTEWRINPAHTMRNSFEDIILPHVLADALINLNPWLEDDQVQDLVTHIGNFGSNLGSHDQSGLLTNNENFLNYVLDQPIISENRQTGEKNPRVQIIDFHPKKLAENKFIAINQFKVPDNNSTQNHMVPDIVLFVNGIPFVVIECKYSHDYNSDSIESAIDQLTYYANNHSEIPTPEGNEQLFYYNAFMIATDKDEAVAGTITSEPDHFREWTQPHPIPDNFEKMNSQEKMILGVLTPSKLLDIIENYLLFMNIGYNRVKIMPRYHQYRAVSKIIDQIENLETPQKRSGVVWHTQGSGKSLSMVFVIKKIRSNEKLKDYKIVAVNDRNDLANQLGQTLGNAEKVYDIGSYDHLEKEVKTDSSNLLNVLAHKFMKRSDESDVEINVDLEEVEDEIHECEEDIEISGSVDTKKEIKKDDLLKREKKLEELNESERILIIVDEAHRTQSGIFGDNIRSAMPKATLIGFTGTPLMGDRKDTSTALRFGKYIDVYTMRDSIREKFTLPILYTGKSSDDIINDPNQLDTDFFDMFADKSEMERAIIKRKYGSMKAYIEAESRIQMIAKDIVNHFIENIFDNGTKAQIVAYTRLAAIRFKKAIDQELENYGSWYESQEGHNPEILEKINILSSCAYVTYNPKETEIALVASEAENQLGDRQSNFKASLDVNKPETGLSFLIVQNKLLTGFDAPIEQVMYIDRKMRDHNLLQAIARVNRIYPNKSKGMIVDYIGFTSHLSEALDKYIEEQIPLDSIISNIEDELPKLELAYRNLLAFFQNEGISKIEDYVKLRIEPDEEIDILEACIRVFIEIDKRVKFKVLLQEFADKYATLHRLPEVSQYHQPFKSFTHILARVRNRFKDRTVNIRGAEKKVKKLIDQHLVSQGIETEIDPIDILSETFEKIVEKEGSNKGGALAAVQELRYRISIDTDSDPGFFGELSEKIDNVIGQYEEDWEKQIEMFEIFLQELRVRKDSSQIGSENYLLPYIDMVKSKYNINMSDDKMDQYKETFEAAFQVLGSIDIRRYNNALDRKQVQAKIDDLLIAAAAYDIQLYNQKDGISADLVSFYLQRNTSIVK